MSAAVPRNRTEAVGSSIVPLLSLNLILLAFFILLNALSEFQQDRTRAVIESVQQTFKGQIDARQSSVLKRASLGALPETRALMNEVGSMFKAVFPAAQSKEERRATVLRIELPAEFLFLPGEGGIRNKGKRLLRRLAKTLTRDRGDGLVYSLEVLLGVRRGGLDGGPAEPVSRHTAVLARRLTNEGLPPAALSLGALPGRPGIVEFVLQVRARPEPPAGLGAPAE